MYTGCCTGASEVDELLIFCHKWRALIDGWRWICIYDLLGDIGTIWTTDLTACLASLV